MSLTLSPSNFLIFAGHFKGEVVSVDFALNGINGIFSTGIVNGDIKLGQTQGDGSGTKRGLDIVKVSLGFFSSCFEHPSLPVIFPHPIRLTVWVRKGNILGTLPLHYN